MPLGLAIYQSTALVTAEGRARTTEFLRIALDFYLMAAAGHLHVSHSRRRMTLCCCCAFAKIHGRGPVDPLSGWRITDTTHVFVCAGLLFRTKTGTMALALICSTVLNVVLNCLLLPRFSLQGAAVALLLTHIVTILLLWLASVTHLPIGVRVTGLAKYGDCRPRRTGYCFRT